MKWRGLMVVALALAMAILASCGDNEDKSLGSVDAGAAGGGAAGTCLAGDPSCEGFDDTAPPDTALPDAGPPLSEQDPGTTLVEVEGVFYADSTGAYLCASLAESFPPQCGEQIARFEGDLDTILAYVGEVTGDADPSTDEINHEGDVWWTDDTMIEWILPGEDIIRI